MPPINQPTPDQGLPVGDPAPASPGQPNGTLPQTTLNSLFPLNPVAQMSPSDIANVYGPRGCGAYVSDVARATGLPTPSLESVAELDSDLPNAGWTPVHPARAQSGDIVVTPGADPSQRRISIYQGNGQSIKDFGHTSTYKGEYQSVDLKDPQTRFYASPVIAGQSRSGPVV